MTDKTASELEQAVIEAALEWHSAVHPRNRFYGSVNVTEDRVLAAGRALFGAVEQVLVHRFRVDSLLHRSPLGTPEAQAIEADPEVVKATLRRADELEAQSVYAQCVREGKRTWDFDDYEECFKAGFMKGRGHDISG